MNLLPFNSILQGWVRPN